eukprot:GDKK01010950.1.p1 GENE.GDKK01010950.1~~GDKK01010950.1.p1  ORF type:complete len:780 (-),score=160.78 GDKK01010950.1:195-2534(-)
MHKSKEDYQIGLDLVVSESKSRLSAMIVLFAAIVSIVLICDGVPPDVIFVTMACLFGIVGIVTPSDVLSGLSNSGLVCLGAIFVIANAMRETVMSNKFAALCLSSTSTVTGTLIRMAFPVMILSALLSAPFVVTMLIPFVVQVAHRIDAHPGKLLMPLAFFSALGGMCSFVGSPANLLNRNEIHDNVTYKETVPFAALTALLGACLVIFTAPKLLSSSGAIKYLRDKEADRDLNLKIATEVDNNDEHIRIEVLGDGTVQINKGIDEDAFDDYLDEKQAAASRAQLSKIGKKPSGFDGTDEGEVFNNRKNVFQRTGAEHLEYHVLFEVTDGAGRSIEVDYPLYDEADFVNDDDESDIDPNDEDLDNETAPIVIKQTTLKKNEVTQFCVKQLGLHRVTGARLLQITDFGGKVLYPLTNGISLDYVDPEEYLSGIVLQPGYALKFAVLPSALPFLRRFQGIKMSTEDETRLLGAHRRQRCLAEVVLHADSPLCRRPLESQFIIDTYGMVVVSARRQEGPPLCYADFDGFQCQNGDVLLVECYKTLVDYPPTAFCLVKAVPFSQPPRSGRLPDFIRAWGNFFFIFCVSMSTFLFQNFEFLPIFYMLLIVMFFVLKLVTAEDVGASMQGSMLVTLGASMVVAKGLANSGVLVAVGRLVCFIGSPLGHIGTLIAFYLVVNILSMFLSSCIALQIGFKVLDAMADFSSLTLPAATLIAVIAANCTFSTPFGNPQFITVVSKGQYSFTDFMRYGLPIQTLIGTAVVTALYFVGKASDWGGTWVHSSR